MYAKIFKSLWDGSMRGQSDMILVFVNLLTHVRHDGVVDRGFQAIADETGLSLDRVKKAIRQLEAVDKGSRTNTENGRRIVRLDDHRDWGWQVVNYCKYRVIRNEQDRREYKREYMRGYMRERRKAAEKPENVNSVRHVLDNVNHVNPKQKQKQMYKEEEEARARAKPSPRFKKPTPEEVTEYAQAINYQLDGHRFCDFYESKGWKIGNAAMKSWKAAVRTWKTRDDTPEQTAPRPSAPTAQDRRNQHNSTVREIVSAGRQARVTALTPEDYDRWIEKARDQYRAQPRALKEALDILAGDGMSLVATPVAAKEAT